MAGKGTLSFNLTGTGAAGLRRMMVQLRDTTLKLSQSGLSDQTLLVDEGRYYVSTRTPDGDEQIVAGPIEVPAGASLSLDLPVEAAPGLGRRKAVTPPMADHGAPAAGAVPAPTVDAALWQGGWLSWWIEQARPEQVQVPVPDTKRPYALDTAYPLIAPTTRDALLLAVDEGRSGKITFFTVPFDGPVPEPQWRPTRVTITRSASISASRRPESLELAFAFDDPEVTQLLEFVREGLVRESHAYSQAAIEAARSELLYTAESPLGAVIGIYVLLRANALDGLDRATENLMNIARSMARGLPDALPLRVEYLARTAQHGKAIELLQEAQASGCPWFRSGITYLLSRARLYLDASSTTTISLASRTRAEIILIASGLEMLSAYLDPNRTVATYRDVPVAS